MGDLPEFIRSETQKYESHGSEKPASQSWPDCPASLSLTISYVSDSRTQTDIIACNHEMEINSRIKNELIIRQKQLLNYNKETFMEEGVMVI
ncbi:hypothetical protein RclHR1_03500021 [Rhizophagus clarus]|uniref:Uncharacterized protein n=1 Tax=Rhizophagus clarus TaxID=94130 RepID=A0A2Z6S5A5_9GLOM|nr:hypothetical protein RclHR1_03500021 [Rhizophagus clarus]